jgi:hypothetical protein
MNTALNHEGAYEAVLSKLNNISLPAAENLKIKVERGECLNEFELERLSKLIETASQLKHIETIDQRKEKLSERFTYLLSSISKQALLNEQLKNSQKH